MGDGLVLQLLLLVALIIGSGLLSGAEAAYFSLGRARLRRIAAERPEGATAPVVSRPHDLLVTLLVGITVINIGASALATHVAHFVFGPRWGLLVELIGMVVLLTTFGEVLPMTLAVKYPERFLALVERPVRWLEVLLAPIRGVLAGLTMLTVRLLGRGGTAQAALSEEELRTLVDVGAREGVVEREEREMIHKVFELEDTLVRSVMVPRTDMFCLDVETPASEILPALREQPLQPSHRPLDDGEEALGIFHRERHRQHLAEGRQQDDHRDQLDEQAPARPEQRVRGVRGQRRGADVDERDADEQRDEQVVRARHDRRQGALGPLGGDTAQPRAPEREVRGFGPREQTRGDDEGAEQQQLQDQAVTHGSARIPAPPPRRARGRRATACRSPP